MSWNNIIGIRDLERKDLEKLFTRTREMKENKVRNVLSDKISVLAFFEPSTRTRLSFKAAIHKLGGDTISITRPEASSLAKGETFSDTIKILDGYGDILIVRHNFEGSAKLSAEIADSPIVNAGDGSYHHPTQTMLDLYTIYELFGQIDDLNIGMIGDLKYARTIFSLYNGLTSFDPNMIYLISPPRLGIREALKYRIEDTEDCKIVENPKDVIEELDVLYVTRLQEERFPDPLEFKRVKGSYKVDLPLLEEGKKGLKVLHPLPRRDEISRKVDGTSYAAYFQQAAWGVPVRMALLSLINETIENKEL